MRSLLTVASVLSLAAAGAAQTAHSGTAASPSVDLTGTLIPTLTFGCNYQTDTTGAATDQRFVRIFQISTSSLVLNEQLSTVPGNATALACAAMGTWHNHSVLLNPAWGQIKIEFYFNTVNGNANAFAGWFVDDVKAFDSLVPLLNSNLDTPADAAGWTFTNSDPSVGWAADGTPASMAGGAAVSAPASLNYNDGTDYDNPGPPPAFPPTIQLNPTSFTFTAQHGGANPASQSLTVTNAGAPGSTLNFAAALSHAWLSLSPANGTLAAGASATLTVSVNSSGVAPGTYTGAITVGDSNATNTPQTAAVTLTVTPAPALSITGVTPRVLMAGTTATLQVTGQDFTVGSLAVNQAALVRWDGTAISAASVTPLSATSATATFTIPATTVAGLYVLRMIRSDGQDATFLSVEILDPTVFGLASPAALLPGSAEAVVFSIQGIDAWGPQRQIVLEADFAAQGIVPLTEARYTWGNFTGNLAVPSGTPYGRYDVRLSIDGSPPHLYPGALIVDNFTLRQYTFRPPSRLLMRSAGSGSQRIEGRFTGSPLPTVRAVRTSDGRELTASVAELPTDGLGGLTVEWTWDPQADLLGTYDIQVVGTQHDEWFREGLRLSTFELHYVSPRRWSADYPQIISLVGADFVGPIYARLKLAEPWAATVPGYDNPDATFPLRGESETRGVIFFQWNIGQKPGVYDLTLKREIDGAEVGTQVVIGDPPADVHIVMHQVWFRTGFVTPGHPRVYGVQVVNDSPIEMPESPFRVRLRGLTFGPGFSPPSTVGPLAPGSRALIPVMIQPMALGDLPSEFHIWPSVGTVAVDVMLGFTLEERAARLDEAAGRFGSAVDEFLAAEAQAQAEGFFDDRSAELRDDRVAPLAIAAVIAALCKVVGSGKDIIEAAMDISQYMDCIKKNWADLENALLKLAGSPSGVSEAAAATGNAAALISGSDRVANLANKVNDLNNRMKTWGEHMNAAAAAAFAANAVLLQLQADREANPARKQELLNSAAQNRNQAMEALAKIVMEKVVDELKRRLIKKGLGHLVPYLDCLSLAWDGVKAIFSTGAEPDPCSETRQIAMGLIGTSFDPNDKMIGGAAQWIGTGPSGEPTGFSRAAVRTDRPIRFLIRFENSARDPQTGDPLNPLPFPALVVQVEDDLDPNLDPQSVQFEGSSHPGALATQEVVGSKVRWVFRNMNLPPNVNSPEGEGFVSFSVRTKAGTASGTVVANFARIWFDPDENPNPIQTNTVDVLLDDEPPSVEEATILSRTGSEVRIRIRAQDRHDGVQSLRILRRPGPTEPWDEAAVLPGTPSGAGRASGDLEASLPAIEENAAAEFLVLAIDRAGNVSVGTTAKDADTGGGGGGGGGMCLADRGLDASLLALALLGAAYAAVRLARAARGGRISRQVP